MWIVLFSMQSCWLAPAAANFFIRSIVVIGTAVEEIILIETIVDLIDSGYRAIFKRAADKTESAAQADIRPLSSNQPLLGRKTSDHKYLVQVAVNQENNTITIPTELILFKRDNTFSKWYLTQDSRDTIEERLEVASIQHALILKNYPTGRMDGIRGKKTSRALEMFQRDVGIPQTGRIDGATRELLLGEQ